MSLQLINQSQQEWLAKGGVPDALDDVAKIVEGLATKAHASGVSFKSVEISDDLDIQLDNTTEVVPDANVTNEVPADEAEDGVEQVTDVDEIPAASGEAQAEVEATDNAETVEAPVEKSFQEVMSEVITKAIAVAIKQYHDDVVVPLVEEVKIVKSQGTTTNTPFNVFGMSDMLPSAAIAEALKKEFNVESVEPESGTVPPTEDKSVIDSAEIDMHQNQSAGLLADF